MEWYPIKLSTHVRAYAFGERTSDLFNSGQELGGLQPLSS